MAAALVEVMGGTPEQVSNGRGKLQMEHQWFNLRSHWWIGSNLCIERNTMGAIKANAAELAMETDAKKCKVPLDKVVDTMATVKDMNSK
jgi:L-serine dehydratase